MIDQPIHPDPDHATRGYIKHLPREHRAARTSDIISPIHGEHTRPSGSRTPVVSQSVPAPIDPATFHDLALNSPAAPPLHHE
jgi:hypothetical protein